MVVFGQKSECIWDKSGCIRAKMFYLGRSGSIRAKVVVFGQSCVNRLKVVVIGQKWF